MYTVSFGGFQIETLEGDISDQPDMAAVVNAANAQLLPGGGVAGALHRAAGPGVAEECRPLSPIKPGEAVITSAHELPNKFVIHSLGPVYGYDMPEEDLLSDCYGNALRLAEENEIDSVAFPAISTGAFGFPFTPAADLALRTVKNEIQGLRNPKRMRFVVFGRKELGIYESKIAEIFDD
ncbi:MAG TPA: macro domain-containing protein [Aridibacter sp.]|nr:macro domain-containing protein [Aridibacter sp.]